MYHLRIWFSCGNVALHGLQRSRDDFFSYLTDFSYFPLIKIFRKLQDTVRTVKKGPVEKRCRWRQLFFIDFKSFYFLTRIIREIKQKTKNKNVNSLLFYSLININSLLFYSLINVNSYCSAAWSHWFCLVEYFKRL